MTSHIVVPDPDLEREISTWRAGLAGTGDVGPDDIDELESHLREEIAELRDVGLSPSEALIIATRRIGRSHDLSREYFKVNVNRLWKRLAVPGNSGTARKEAWLTVVLAVAAALLAQIPYLFGGSYFDAGREVWGTFASLWVLPSLIAWFVYRHNGSPRRIVSVAALLALVHLAVALYPYAPESNTRVLVMLHIPFLSWLLLLPVAVDQSWKRVSGTVHYLRLSAEAFLYAALLGMGGLTLVGLTAAIFASAEIDILSFLGDHVVIAGLFGIPPVAVTLADRKRQVIENFAPTLARIFVPLFALSIGTFLVTLAVTGTRPAGDRDLLFVMNVLLLLVVAMLFYDVSARHEDETRRVSDWANLILMAATIVLNVVALSGIASRLLEYGATPNRATVFGLNAILLVHLSFLIATYIRHMAGRVPFQAIERMVVRFLPVYGVWLATVVLVFPLLFRGA